MKKLVRICGLVSQLGAIFNSVTSFCLVRLVSRQPIFSKQKLIFIYYII